MPTPPALRQQRDSRIHGWLAAGGIVLTANERAARSLTAAFHEARQAEGRLAWQTPAIFAWDGWVQAEWESRDLRGLLALNSLQEKWVWTEVIAKSARGRGLLNAGRLAVSAQRAYQLLCGYAPDSLQASARSGWQGDASEFSQWMESFEKRCRREGLISRSRLALDLAATLSETASQNREQPRLLLAGFDRLLASQRALLEASGSWQLDAVEELLRPHDLTGQHFYEATDGTEEIRGCVAWIRERLTANPTARWMVVVPDLEARRGELERELLAIPGAKYESGNLAGIDFEFSMGLPLSQMGHARSALLLLKWLHAAHLGSSLTEPEVDWLLGSGHSTVSADEEIALAEAMLRIRRRGRERPSWYLKDFLVSEPFRDRELTEAGARGPLVAWARRTRAASEFLQAFPERQSPMAWVETARELLETAGWPGFRPLSSVDFQVCERWERTLEECGSLGFASSLEAMNLEAMNLEGMNLEGMNLEGMTWQEFVSTLTEAVGETVFSPESSDARVQFTGALESAGQVADGIWFLGADEENWPGRGQPHPLLPIGLQRDAEMPHASPQADWRLARQATQRLVASAEEVVFSYARQSAEAETRPSRLALRLLRAPEPMPAVPHQSALDKTERFADGSMIPFPLNELRGGAGILTSQSNCPFQAFALSRLQAEDLEPAQTGLNARQRGILLHSVLHRVWSGPARGGIASHAELLALPHLRPFIEQHVGRAMRDNFDQWRTSALPNRFPARYLELESERLTRLVVEWLQFERNRVPFHVAETEVDTDVTVAGLSLRLRLDRIDTVPNAHESRALVIDYKSAEVGPKVWAGDRPENVQLPLYATFAIGQESYLEGLAIAQVRPGKPKFCGRVRNANISLDASLSKSNGLVKDPLTDAQLDTWRRKIEQLGEDYLRGRADVDPREPGKTCETCHLHAVCRINENELLDVLAGEDDESTGEDQEPGAGNA